MKGRSVRDEIAETRDFLPQWRCGEPEVFEVGAGLLDPPTTVVRVAWADPSRIGWPLARNRQAAPPGVGTVLRSKREVS